MPVLVKICGTTSPLDARLAQEAGADFLGVILNHPPSPRHVAREMADEIRRATTVPLVLLSVNQSLETLLQLGADFQPRALQLHGDEKPELVRELAQRGFKVWKAISGDEAALFQAARAYREAGAEAILVDARETSPNGIVYGGTGHLADWNAARHLVDEGYRIILAGGLSPENVTRAVETVRPWSVDVVSGVEARKGVKDAEKIGAFVQLAKKGTTVDKSSGR
jgi:phosphoribosylanthranilate isomerase